MTSNEDAAKTVSAVAFFLEQGVVDSCSTACTFDGISA